MTKRLTAQEIEAIRKRAEASPAYDMRYFERATDKYAAAFYESAREDIPTLLAEVERLREALIEIADIDDWDYGLELAKDITFKTIGEPEGWDGMGDVIDRRLGEHYEDVAKEAEAMADV